MLNHSKRLTGSDGNDQYLMYGDFTRITHASIKNDDAAGANLVFPNSGEVLSGSSCGYPIQKHGNCGFPCATTGVQQTAVDLSAYIYPNPSSGVFHIMIPIGLESPLIRIFDMTGKLIYQEQFPITVKDVEIGLEKKLTPGIYTIELITENAIGISKIIIQ